MARRVMTGQLNMFDFYRNLDANSDGEVEMVSLMPWEEVPAAEEEEPVVETLPVEEEEPVVETLPVAEILQKAEAISVIEEVPAVETIPTEEVPTETKARTSSAEKLKDSQEKVAMRRIGEQAGVKIEIAYINYNKVRITEGDNAPQFYEFSSSKEAVDFYVNKMQELEPEEE